MFGVLKKYDVHLSPDVYGRITLEGIPLASVEVLRGLTYGDEDELIDSTKTDESGHFFFKEKTIRSRKPVSIFDESRIRQVIVAKYENQEFMLWHKQEIGIEPSKALTERLQKLNCNLSDSEEKIRVESMEYPNFKHLIHSICRW